MKEEIVRGMPLSYWKQNAEENYNTTPISVLKYITCLEEAYESAKRKDELVTKLISMASLAKLYLRDKPDDIGIMNAQLSRFIDVIKEYQYQSQEIKKKEETNEPRT